MAGSSEFGKLYISLVLMKLHEFFPFQQIIDLGVGSGTYSNLLRERLAGSNWTGVEIWEPYVGEHGLEAKYDTLLVKDMRDPAALASRDAYDLAIAGDVLEHMEVVEAQAVAERCLDKARLVLISIPVVHSPQGEEHNNPYEAHVKDDYSNEEVLETFTNIATAFVHNHKGIYFLTKDPQMAQAAKQVHGIAAKLVMEKFPDHFISFSTV